MSEMDGVEVATTRVTVPLGGTHGGHVAAFNVQKELRGPILGADELNRKDGRAVPLFGSAEGRSKLRSYTADTHHTTEKGDAIPVTGVFPSPVRQCDVCGCICAEADMLKASRDRKSIGMSWCHVCATDRLGAGAAFAVEWKDVVHTLDISKPPEARLVTLNVKEKDLIQWCRYGKMQGIMMNGKRWKKFRDGMTSEMRTIVPVTKIS